MGASKRLLEEQQAQLDSTIEMLVEHGAARNCEFHGYAVDAEDGDAVESVKLQLAEEIGTEEANTLVENAMANLYWECPGMR